MLMILMRAQARMRQVFQYVFQLYFLKRASYLFLLFAPYHLYNEVSLTLSNLVHFKGFLKILGLEPEGKTSCHSDLLCISATRVKISQLAYSKSANKPLTSCVLTACYKFSIALEPAVNNL